MDCSYLKTGFLQQIGEGVTSEPMVKSAILATESDDFKCCGADEISTKPNYGILIPLVNFICKFTRSIRKITP